LEIFLSERRTALRRSYHTLTAKGEANAKRLAEFFSRNGQGLLPRVDLIERSRMAVDELVDVAGRATIEAVLQLSTEQVAGPRARAAAAGSSALARAASRARVSEGT
jgi:hypothetical protein